MPDDDETTGTTQTTERARGNGGDGPARGRDRPHRGVGTAAGPPPARPGGAPRVGGTRRAPRRPAQLRRRADDRLLPGPPRAPADRGLREPGLPGLDPLLLRHRQRQRPRLLRLPRPRPRPLRRAARWPPPPGHLGRAGALAAPQGQAPRRWLCPSTRREGRRSTSRDRTASASSSSPIPWARCTARRSSSGRAARSRGRAARRWGARTVARNAPSMARFRRTSRTDDGGAGVEAEQQPAGPV